MQRLACICRRFKKANQSQSKTDKYTTLQHGFRNFLYVCLNLLQKKSTLKQIQNKFKKLIIKKQLESTWEHVSKTELWSI